MDEKIRLESLVKLRERLLRLIKLGEANLSRAVEDCIRHLFTNSCSVHQFVEEVQRILNVTIKANLSNFLLQTIPSAQDYLRKFNCDPYSWETFKTIPLQLPDPRISSTTRLPSLEQARFRLPPSCPQLIDLTSSLVDSTSTVPEVRADANAYQQNLIHRFAQYHFYLDESGEKLILQTLDRFLKYLIQRLFFFTNHRIDVKRLNSDQYDPISNVREQIRFLLDLQKVQQVTMNSLSNNENEQNNRTTFLDELRRKEADETASHVLRESRLKRQKLSNDDTKSTVVRFRRANLQDLISVMEDEKVLRRSKLLFFAYANR